MNSDTLASALCAQVDPYVWFSDKGAFNATAKAMCHDCDEEAGCLAIALANPELSGIWGGTTQRERQRMHALAAQSLRHNRARPIKHGTEGGAQAHRRRSETICLMCKAAESLARKCRIARMEEVAAW